MSNPNLDETSPTPLNKGMAREETSPNLNTTDPNSLQETQPSPVKTPDSSENNQAATPPGGPGGKTTATGGLNWKPLALVAILTLLIIAGISAYGGYRSGIQERASANAAQLTTALAEQYQLALQDIEANNLQRAQERLVYIINQDPNFPDAPDRLAEVLLHLNITATATPAPTPTLTPTPDLRSVEELFTQAQQAMAGSDWSTAIENLLKLRKDQPDYHAIEVDDMLYLALQYRGVDKIKKGDLEGGTYDLALAERFGPLYVESKNWRDWAELYITGASFWDVDWSQVVSYFQQLAQIAPNLMDSSGWTSTYRLKVGYGKYGDQLFAAGECDKAQEMYKSALDMPGGAPTIEPTATFVAEKCAPTPVPVSDTATPTVTETLPAVVTTPPPAADTPTATNPPPTNPPATNPPAPQEPTSTPTPPPPQSPTEAPTATTAP